MKNIVHIDLNAFFAQVEEIKNPSLIGKPVAIGSPIGRSVVSTANYVARKFGVGSGMPITVARRLCPQLIIVDGHYHEYSLYSNKFMSYLKNKFPILEQASVDECYIDMSDYFTKEEAHDFLLDLQIELFKAVNLKCSIGVGDNRFLAKMGSDYRKPLGLTILYKENIKDILWPIPIEKMYGIGKKTFPHLKALGINTIGDLANTNDSQVKRILGSTFYYHQGHANGEGDNKVYTDEADPKSVSSAHTFETDTTDYDEIKNCIIYNAKSVAKSLQSYHKITNTIVITFRNTLFVTTSKRMHFDEYFNDEASIVSHALLVFEKYYNGEPLRLLGVGASNIKDEGQMQVQGTLFDHQETKKDNIDDIIKTFNDKLEVPGLVKASSIKTKPTKVKKENRFHVKDKDEDENI